MGIWIFFSIITFFKKWNLKNSEENRLFKFGTLWSILTFLLLSFIKMKKERYGFPIYVVSSIPIGIILNYYINSDWNLLKKSDKILFYIQATLITILSIGSVGLIFWKKPNFYYLTIPFFILLVYLFKDRLIDRKNFKKKVIYLSGFLLLIVNCNLTWIIENEIRNKNSSNLIPLETLQKNNKLFHIYSKDFTIEDVWSVGQNIHFLDDNTILPEKFYILSKNSKFDLENNYKIEYKETYSRFKDDDDLIYIYKVINNK